MIEETLEDSINKFAEYVDGIKNKNFKDNNYKYAVPGVTVTIGKSYAKLINTELYDDKDLRTRAAYCFIALKDINTKSITAVKGDILKPASWSAPAKWARGNIFDESTFTCANPSSIEYRK